LINTVIFAVDNTISSLLVLLLCTGDVCLLLLLYEQSPQLSTAVLDNINTICIYSKNHNYNQ
jgi:hypothetical protein